MISKADGKEVLRLIEQYKDECVAAALSNHMYPYTNATLDCRTRMFRTKEVLFSMVDRLTDTTRPEFPPPVREDITYGNNL